MDRQATWIAHCPIHDQPQVVKAMVDHINVDALMWAISIGLQSAMLIGILLIWHEIQGRK